MSKCKVIAIANQKGGVAKTTTTLNLGAGLVRKGKKVLLIDFDPQGDLTTSLGFSKDQVHITIQDILYKNHSNIDFDNSVGVMINAEKINLIPANNNLKALEDHLISDMNREYVLSEYLAKIKNDYDYILIDCQPSLGLLTINALAAADSVIIPVQAQYLPLKGMTELIQTVDKVKAVINPNIKVDGVLITLADVKTRLAKATETAIRNNYGNKIKVYNSVIPIATRVAESTTEGKSIYAYDKSSKATIAYEKFTEEVLQNRERTKPRSTQCR